MKNPLLDLVRVGQSVWYDQMQRSLITSGSLRKMIDEDGLRGLTSNPTIFDKAIAGSSDYDEQLRTLAREGRDADEIYEAIVTRDIGDAADIFRPVYDRTGGTDGFVSLEVRPGKANDTQATIDEVEHFWKKLSRPNLMMKIPATPEGLPAIEESIARGYNVNITLIFARDVYRQVIEAYLRGLERRLAARQPIGRVASVASFFVSRIDSKVDKRLEKKIETASGKQKEELSALLGRIAIANAKLAYQTFKEVFGSDRFARLREHGARVQRPLWASTSTKNPAYSDVMYVHELIGPDTVNTVPPATLDAFRDHGVVRETLDDDVDGARQVLEGLEAAGISLDEVTTELTREGVGSFTESFDSLMSTIEERRARFAGAEVAAGSTGTKNR
ncbi:MAG: transaldolase [Thermoanaerobaculia bacterium]